MKFRPPRPPADAARVEVPIAWDLQTWPPKPLGYDNETDETDDAEESAR